MTVAFAMFFWDPKSPQWYLEECCDRNSGVYFNQNSPVFIYVFNSQLSISRGFKSTARTVIDIVLHHLMQGTWVSEDFDVHSATGIGSSGGNSPRILRDDCIYNTWHTDGEGWMHARMTCNDAHGEDFKRHKQLCSKNESSLCLCCSVSHLLFLGATSVTHFLSFNDNLCSYKHTYWWHI